MDMCGTPSFNFI